MMTRETLIRTLALAAGAAMAAFVLVGARAVGQLALFPGPYLDKLAHATYYGIMAALFDRGFGLRRPLLAVALMPMVIHQAASLSWDSIAFGIGFLYCATVIRYAVDDRFTALQKTAVIALAAIVGLCKVDIALVPLVFLTLSCVAMLMNPLGRERRRLGGEIERPVDALALR